MTSTHELVALPSGRRGQVPHGTGLRAALRGLGLDIESVCAENSTCGKCKVVLELVAFPELGVESSVTSLSPAGEEEMDYMKRRRATLEQRGWDPELVRLACQAKVLGDVVVTVPDDSVAGRQVVRKSASDRKINVRPSLRKYLVELTAPTLANPRSDWERLASGVATSMGLVRSGEVGLPRASDLRIDVQCLRGLPEILRKGNWRVTVTIWQDREVVRVEPGFTEALIGAAVDVGTTTMALYLCDLVTGETLAAESDMNPQIAFGEDVMSRIQFSQETPDGLEQLNRAVIRMLNKLLLRAATSAGVKMDDVLELVMVGNTTMQHLFLRIPPRYLGTSPFTPGVAQAVDIKARELGIAINTSGNVHVLPAIASFIGADTTAVLLAEEPHEQDEVWLIIDIGTNAELVLGGRQRLVCASTPTGPAFEGAHIEHGMRAAPGAVEHVRIPGLGGEPQWKIIGESEWCVGRPMGLCGSAVIDAVAELVRLGLVDSSGRYVHVAGADRLREGPSGPEYVIVYGHEAGAGKDISLTQKDVRQIQLAKAALVVAAESLLREFGLATPDKLLLAGAFGSYIDKAQAVAIGMLPPIELERIFVVGNAAGDGARIALLNVQKRMSAPALVSRVTRHELPTDPDFQERFIGALAFPGGRGSAGAKHDPI